MDFKKIFELLHITEYDPDSIFICSDGITILYKKFNDDDIYSIIYDLQKRKWVKHMK